MRSKIVVDPQPNDTTCGPTCLHAIYRYFGDERPLDEIIAEVPALAEGGTLAVHLGCHGRRRGYRATIYTYKLQLFDPTWFRGPGVDLRERLQRQLEFKTDEKFSLVSRAYIEFLQLGGVVRMDELTTALLRRYLRRGIPILAGLSATYLYGALREHGPHGDEDDLRGEPVGHFVVLSDYEPVTRNVHIADPMEPNPMAEGRHYTVGIDRLVAAILLGVLTYDAALLVLEPARRSKNP